MISSVYDEWDATSFLAFGTSAHWEGRRFNHLGVYGKKVVQAF
jgi:hypothetical protein